MNRKRGTVVLGQELADARKAEAARTAAGPGGRSPMPQLRYDDDSGDFNLELVVRRPIDEELRALSNEFRQWDPGKRDDARQNISMDEFYTLIHFAKRSAVLAMNEGSAERCEEGLAALALIDESRIDPRDAAWAAGLLSYAARATTGDQKQLFDRAIEMSTAGMGEILRGSGRRAELSEWGYAEIRTKNGLGLIGSDWAPYEPTVELSVIALAVADWLSKGRYKARATIAVEVPEIWFSEKFRGAAQAALRRARGAVSISGRLRERFSAEASSQMFIHWLVELPSERESEQLVTYAGCRLSGRFSVGYSYRSLFGLLVAGSVVSGVAPYESEDSLASLVQPLKALIGEAWSQRQA